jgi:hypothetical protein
MITLIRYHGFPAQAGDSPEPDSPGDRFMTMSRLAVSVVTVAAAFMVGCNSTQKSATSSTAETKVVDTSKPINGSCPISSAKLDGAAPVTVAYQDKTVGFCCAGCVGKWTKLSDTEKNAKLAAAK